MGLKFRYSVFDCPGAQDVIPGVAGFKQVIGYMNNSCLNQYKTKRNRIIQYKLR